MMLNYKTVFVSDANAARTDEDHNASLAAVFRVFGAVVSTEEVIGMLMTQQKNLGRERAETI